MAYESQVSRRARGVVIAAVCAIHIGLLFALLNLSGNADLQNPQSALHVIDIRQLIPPRVRERHEAKPRPRAGGAAPKNIRSEATQVAAPKPQVNMPRLPQIAAADLPHQGTASTQGASPSPGPGSGAGGAGTGTGSGASGNGSSAGDTGIAESPRLTSPVMSGRDFSRGQLSQWPPGATVFLRLRIDRNGVVSECMIDRATGIAEIDREMCNMAHERLHFRPAINRSGQPVAGWFGYAQPAPR